MAKVSFRLVMPEREVLATEADMVVVPGSEGDFGVLHGHAPLISTVRPGVLEVLQGNKVEQRFIVVGGFAEVTPERCTVLADEAMPFDEVTRRAARRARAGGRARHHRCRQRRRKGRRGEGPGRRQGPATGPGLLRQPLTSSADLQRATRNICVHFCTVRPLQAGPRLALLRLSDMSPRVRPWQLDTRNDLLGSLRRVEGRSGDPAQHQGCGLGGA